MLNRQNFTLQLRKMSPIGMHLPGDQATEPRQKKTKLLIPQVPVADEWHVKI